MTKDQESGGAPLEQLPDEALCRLIREQDRPAEEVLAARYHRVVRSCARPYFLAGGDSEDLMQEGMFGLIKAMREYDPDRDASFRTFAETCIRHRLYSVVKAAAAGKHAPLNQSVPLNPSLFEANVSFAQPGPEDLLIDREKAVSLLENVRKQLSEFEVMILGFYLDGLTCREHQVSICAKDSRGPYNYDVVSGLIAAAKRKNLDFAVDIYPHYGSDADVALTAGYDVKHGLIGSGVYASHGYERSHKDGVINTFLLLTEYLK